MPLTANLKSTSLLLILIVMPLATASLPTANAQTTCGTCVSPQTYVPMYLQFGVDPFRQRQINSMHFTPLQSNLYQVPTTGRCLPCESYSPNGYPIVIQDNAIVSPVPQPVEGELSVPPPEPTVSDPATEPDREDTLSSPSDIVLSDDKTVEPTPVDEASREEMAQLDEAEKKIALLKEEITQSREQARVAVERAYAAEKAANAAKTSVEKSQQQLQDEKARLTQLAEKATAESRKYQDMVEQLSVQLREMEKQVAVSPTTAETSTGKSDAEKRVEKLYADSKNAAETNRKKANQSKKKAPSPPTNRIADPKKKPSDVPADQQIKKLEQSMRRQIKNTSSKIRKQNQAAIKKLIDSGKEDSDPEVQALKEKMATELKENEAKIRKRVEARINRIRKAASAKTDGLNSN